MSTGTIPTWNAQGVLPPINPASPISDDRSPYVVSLTEIILRYATSPERNAILDGFLNFRSELHAVGLTSGFQWLDGSFLEHIEIIDSRPPNDIDIVTFYLLQNGATQKDISASNPRLFYPKHTKEDHRVDAYFQQLNTASLEPLVKKTIYWYSLWSHRRNAMWKGYLQVDLAPSEDAAARTSLAAIVNSGGQP